jgi:hypothetical protein
MESDGDKKAPLQYPFEIQFISRKELKEIKIYGNRS